MDYRCGKCSKSSPLMPKCGVCELKYCNRECQSSDWKEHKLVCAASYHDRVAKLCRLIDAGYTCYMPSRSPINLFHKVDGKTTSIRVAINHRNTCWDYNCLICGKIWRHDGPMMKHTFYAHPKMSGYRCPECLTLGRTLCRTTYYPTNLCSRLSKEKYWLFMRFARDHLLVDVIKYISQFMLLCGCE